MLIYFAFTFFITFLFLLGNSNKTIYGTNNKTFLSNKSIRNNHRVALFGFLFLVLVFGLRHESMGNDLRYLLDNGYLGSFDIINSYSWKQVFNIKSFMNYERGYIIFNKLIGSIWDNRQFFLIVVAFVSLFPVYRFIYLNSKSSIVSYFIFMGLPIFLMYFSGIRQVIAVGICLFSLEFVKRKQLGRFILSVVFAFLFHYSAWVFFFSYPLYYIRISKVFRWGTVFALGVIYVFKNRIFRIFAVFLKDEVTISNTGAGTLFLIFVAVYVFSFLLLSEKQSKDEQLNGLLNLFFVACVMQSFSGLHNLAMRVGYYFMIVLVVLLPNVIFELKEEKDRELLLLAVAFCFGVFGLYSLKTSVWAQAVPYHFFWETVL